MRTFVGASILAALITAPAVARPSPFRLGGGAPPPRPTMAPASRPTSMPAMRPMAVPAPRPLATAAPRPMPIVPAMKPVVTKSAIATPMKHTPSMLPRPSTSTVVKPSPSKGTLTASMAKPSTTTPDKAKLSPATGGLTKPSTPKLPVPSKTTPAKETAKLSEKSKAVLGKEPLKAPDKLKTAPGKETTKAPDKLKTAPGKATTKLADKGKTSSEKATAKLPDKVKSPLGKETKPSLKDATKGPEKAKSPSLAKGTPKAPAFDPTRSKSLEQARKKSEQRLDDRRKDMLAKVNTRQREKIERALNQARRQQQSMRRPAMEAGRSVAKKQPVTNAPGKKRSAFRTTPGEMEAMKNGLDRKNLKDQQLLRDITQSRLLGKGALRHARERIAQAMKDGNFNLASALRNALHGDMKRRAMNNFIVCLHQPGWPSGGCIPLCPGGAMGSPGVLTGGACSIEAPPGIDPCAPAACFPCDPGQPNGAGVVCGVDPGSVITQPVNEPVPGDAPPGETGGDQGVAIDEQGTPAESVWQNTRQLRVGNGTREPLKVHVQYETTDNKNQTQWFPQQGGSKSLVFEVQPGEVAQLKDGDWPINATRVRLWAKGQERSYEQFKNKPLDLVPEKDQAGNRGYAAPKMQTFSVSFK